MKELWKDFLPKTSDILPGHDLVFGSPLNDPLAGIPLGDGDTGSLLWFEKDGIHININKTDLWDSSSLDSGWLCSGEEEDLTCLRHGGELVIKTECPCFEFIYQKDFEARLSLASATAHFRAETEFSRLWGECFAFSEGRVTALRLGYSFESQCPLSVRLFRWGSRSFWRWYSQMKNSPESGLSGTEAWAEGDRIYLTQRLNGRAFCIGLQVNGMEARRESSLGGHGVSFESENESSGELTLFWNVSVSGDAETAREMASAALDGAAALGFEEMRRRHGLAWEEFWDRSLVRIENDYIENCLYLSLYYSNSSCRGASPPLFTNGIWGFFHDYYPWCYYFHYNMQHMFAPLEPTGHGDLTEGYYAMRRRGLEAARAYAREEKHREGAFYHDVTDVFGRGAGFDSDNMTPGAQIAMAMYRHYRMNGDESFLSETALPVMRAVGEFYLSLLKKEEDGLWHISNTTAYEGTPLFNDTLTDLVMIRVLFSALAELLPEDEGRLFGEIAEKLPPMLKVPMLDEEAADGCFLMGFGKGKPVFGDGLVFAVGRDGDGNPVRKNYGDAAREFYGFPDTEMSPLYPGGTLGLKDRGTELFGIMKNQLYLHRTPEKCMQWCMMPIYLARMGMGEELWGYIEKLISAWLIFPNGFGADCPVGRDDALDRLRYNRVFMTDSETHSHAEGYAFRHFDMETLPIVANAAVEALLQSYDGVVRPFPGIPRGESAGFRLYAEGGFKVSGGERPGSGAVLAESLRGEVLRLALPEGVGEFRLFLKKAGDDGLCPVLPVWEERGGERVLLFDSLEKGDGIAVIWGEWSDPFEKKSPINKKWKVCGDAHLGTPPLPGHDGEE